ncbi:FAD/NAD(P)-binding protein [Tsukamurella sp. 8F]|uniref:FAD/NAD(P)-binding protein n=1 Tax=unclassified Tsukamurella TaxID=2633480 RepID=UPI0023B91C23|nr:MULTISPECIES: FAD/NAD(P)-binding protein [unclassified Tsukamurella]MDF0531175.1 FAD/NAD(P)-binding protein [Tsukamurella sp. 8J]MDF0585878.1 FAD/NAD(P)-binding protein [Tsukamurella sp. 8F]
MGVGPHGLSVLERLVANAKDVLESQELCIHLIDPYPVGGGRLWQLDQPSELLMNSLPEQVTMYLDETVRCNGPIVEGPSLLDWVNDGSPIDPRVRGADTIQQGRFVTRQANGGYLSVVRDRLLDSLPDSVFVRTHPHAAIALQESTDGLQRITLADGSRVDVHTVVLTLGCLDAVPNGREMGLLRAAEQSGLRYTPPQNSAALDLSSIGAGDEVLVRGMGLSFVDLIALLFEGRGGRFRSAEGRLVYEPHGAEPHVFVGSRRGVPHHAKPIQRLRADPPPLPKFFTQKTLARLMREHDRVNIHEHVRPLIAKEFGWAYYHELFNAYPDRVRCSWSEFAERYTQADRGEIDALVAEMVADDDVFDMDLGDRPLDGEEFSTADDLQTFVRGLVLRDARRRTEPEYSAESAMEMADYSIFNNMGFLWHSGRLDAESYTDGLDWWRGIHNYFSVGAPAHRMEQLVALSEAGFVTFIGADMWVEVDREEGVFRAGGSSVPDQVTARTLIEARLPEPDLDRVRDPMLRDLLQRGEISVETLDVGTGAPVSTGLLRVTPTECRVVDGEGRPHRARFAMGGFTTLRVTAAFHRPGTGSAGFRRSDMVARAALCGARDIAQAERTA